MKSGQVFVRGYNARVAVGDDHLVVACDVSTDNVDHALLEPMIDAVRARLGPDEDDSPVEFLADAGYWKGEAVERLRHRGERVLVPPNGRPRTRGLRRQHRCDHDHRAARRAGDGEALPTKTGACRTGHRSHQVQPSTRSLPAARNRRRTARADPRLHGSQPDAARTAPASRLKTGNAPRSTPPRAPVRNAILESNRSRPERPGERRPRAGHATGTTPFRDDRDHRDGKARPVADQPRRLPESVT